MTLFIATELVTILSITACSPEISPAALWMTGSLVSL
jgi:hypothetical protein